MTTLRRTRLLFVLVLVWAAPLAAQDAEPLPLTPIGLEILSERFDSMHAIVQANLPALTPDQAVQFRAITAEARDALDAMVAKRARPGDPSRVKASLTDYFRMVRAMFPTGSYPPGYNRYRNAITGSFLNALSGDLEEYDRRFAIRYGPDSEPLNIVEMVLVQITSPAPRGAQVRLPGHWEPIARIQLFGYQYDTGGNELVPSSPVAQLGLTYYLYGDSWLAGKLHHIGLAAAYQRDLVNGVNLAGGVIQVAGWDAGAFCDIEACDEPVFMLSRSISAFTDLWTRARKAAAGWFDELP